MNAVGAILLGLAATHACRAPGVEWASRTDGPLAAAGGAGGRSGGTGGAAPGAEATGGSGTPGPGAGGGAGPATSGGPGDARGAAGAGSGPTGAANDASARAGANDSAMATGVAGPGAGSPDGGPPPPAAATGRLRLIVETDAPGGDPDDEGSLVRFLVYANEWDIEGILATRSAAQSRTGVDGKQAVLKFIDAYHAGYENFKQHKPNYPTPDRLRAITKASFTGTEARDLIVSVVDRPDPRPVWYGNWGTNDGNLTGMRQALDHVKKSRTDAEYKKFIAKIHFSRDADRPYHVAEHIPSIPFWVDTRDPDRWYHRWEPLTRAAGGFDINRDVKNNHGPLGALYTIQKEGDTHAFMYLLDVGLSDPLHPTWGGWAGRFAPRTDTHAQANPQGFFWSAAQDAWGGTTSRDNTLARWAAHIQNDFRARMDWAAQPRGGANHEPSPILNGAAGSRHVALTAAPGETVKLSADGSTDPDGNALGFQWIPYPEPGSYRGNVVVDGALAANASLRIPVDAKPGDTIHVVLVATDNGVPPLTRYRRAVLTVR